MKLHCVSCGVEELNPDRTKHPICTGCNCTRTAQEIDDIVEFLNYDPNPSMMDFYKADNDELRKFLTAERVENNRLRSSVSCLREAVGVGVGCLRILVASIRENQGDDFADAAETAAEGMCKLVEQSL